MYRASPRISVLSAVFNGERFLAQAIESVLTQTFSDFEHILIDDASTDGTPQIFERYARLDPRLRILRNPTNLGQSASLNRALADARGEYVVVLDGDDIAYPERLALQTAFLDAHPEIGAVGSQALIIDAAGLPVRTLTLPTTPSMVRWQILFGTPVLAGAAIVRRALLQQAGNFPVHWRYAKDYYLWTRMLTYAPLTNLPETLICYRSHDHQVSTAHASEQWRAACLLIYCMLAERLGLRSTLDDVGTLYRGMRGCRLTDAERTRAAALLAAIHDRYLQVEHPDEPTLAEIEADCARRLLAMALMRRHA